MGAPQAVKKAAKKAEKLQQGLQSTPPVEGAAPAVDPNKGKPAAPPVSSVPAPPPPDGPAPPDPDPNAQGDWEKRYKGLKKVYDDEVPKLRRQLEKDLPELRGSIETKDQQIADLSQKVTDLQTQINSPAEPEPEAIEVTEDEIASYGQPLIDLISKVAGSGGGAKDLAKQVIDLTARLGNLEQGQEHIAKSAETSTRSSFFSELSRLVPNWKQQNDDKGFAGWLAEEVPYTGKERQHYLSEAFNNFDVDAVAKFFTDYEGLGQAAPSSDDIDLSPPIAPDSSHVSEVDTTQANRGKIYSRSEIDKFYQDKRKGKYRNKVEEAGKIERDILAAGKEGRIVG